MSDDTMLGDGESQITLTRRIEANVSDVFSAWTDPALIEQWQADEADHEVSGEVLQFVEDEKLVLSWVHKDEEDELIFVLEILFAETGEDVTTITLTERGLAHADAQTRIFSMEAWSSALEQLAELME